MEGIIKQDIQKRYECEILGFGEVFEIISVERIRKKLIRKHQDGVFYLSSNRDHSGRGFTKEEVERRSFVDLFQDRGQIRLSKMVQRVEATVADNDLSEVLTINLGDPLFFVENIYYSTEGQPVEVTHMYYRGD